MRRLLRHLLVAGACLAVLGSEPRAFAQEPAETTDESVLAARREFKDGAALVRGERWGEALAAFERAAKLKSHAITTYNIAQCERAMGQYTRARRGFHAALAQNEAAGRTELPESVVVESKGLIVELEKILSRTTITLRPDDAAIAVDGRPLERLATDGKDKTGTDTPGNDVPELVAGTLPPGSGAPPGAGTFRLLTNPGAHVIVVSRKGYQDVVVNRTFAPGATTTMSLELDRLPAAIHVTSNVLDAVVRVDDADVGNPPVEIARAAGRYRVVVSRKGFVSYDTDVAVRSGERVELAAALRKESPALTQRWWFWTAAGVLVAGAVVGTYLLTRSDPEPTRSGTDGGGLGWSLQVP